MKKKKTSLGKAMILTSAEESWALWFVESHSWMLFAQSLNGTQWL